jgi:PAS domain S-box-containing protein
MSKSNKLGIQSRFLIFTIFIVLSGLAIVILFLFSVNEMNKNDSNYEKATTISVEYQKMLKLEQLFLVHHSEEKNFFKSGKSKYVTEHEKAAQKINTLLEEFELTNDELNTEIENKIEKLKAINAKYLDDFTEIANKLYLRGSETTGKIGELNQNANMALKLSSVPQLKILIKELNYSLKDYNLHKDTKYYTEFINSFMKIGSILNGKIISNDLAINDSTLIEIIGSENNQLIKELKNYKTNFEQLLKLDKDIGLNSDEGLRKSLKDGSSNFQPEIKFINTSFLQIKTNYKERITIIFVIVSILLFAFIVLFGLIFTKTIAGALGKLNDYLLPISKGVFPEKLLTLRQNNELQKMINSINGLIEGLKKTTSFAEDIGHGTFETKFEPLSKKDALGNSLLEMRKNLIKAQQDEKKRQEEDNLRKWANEGLAEFNEILRQSAGDIDALTLSIVRNITKFLKANQAGLFLINDTKKEDIHLELIATYAYDHERKKQKKIYIGEGLVGMCAVEKSTVYLEDIPQGYLSISSGLGGSSPKSLLIVPLKLEDEIFGVIEIASFNKFRKHEIEFVERVTESISSTLSLAKINTRTAVLLEKSQRQAEEMAAQEEEMRQNFEELQATQEESARREAEMSSIIQAINSSSLVVEFDLNGYIINANDAILKLLNLEAKDLLGKHQGDFEKMDEASIRPEEFWERLRRGEIINESHKITAGGETRWLHQVYTPILNAEGEPYKILNLATDITDSKKLEQKLLDKAEEMSYQEEELRKNLIELEKTQKEMAERQYELEEANDKIKTSEQTLKDAIEKAKEGERRLKARNAALAEQEVDYIKKIQELEFSLKKLKLDNEDVNKANSKLSVSEKTLKKFLKEAKDQQKKLEEQLLLSQEKENNLLKEMDILIAEIEKLKKGK